MKLNYKNSRALFKGIILAGLLFFLIPNSIYAENIPVKPEGWTEGYVFVNNVRIHYYQAAPAPGKPVIVMVHGVTDNGLCWTTLSLKLQEKYDIYMLDTRGHGLSDPFTPLDSARTLADDVAGFVKAMNFNKPIIMGHSMGAATVMRVGADYPDLAQAVIMLDPFLVGFKPRNPESKKPSTQKNEAKASTESKKPKQQNLSVSMMGEPETLVAQNNYSYKELVNQGRRQNPKWDDMDVQYWALSKKQYHGAYTKEAWQVMSGIMRTGDALSRIPVPSLVLKADASLESKKANEQAVKDLKKVTLIHIDGAAHNLHHDELERTVKEITEFLSKI